MPINASIPLQVKQFKSMGPGEVLSLRKVAEGLKLQDMQMEEYRRKRESENALRTVFSSPDAVDPVTKQPTANTLQRVMSIDPQAGLKLRGDMMAAEEKRAVMEKNIEQARKSQNEADLKILDRIAIATKDAYEKFNAEDPATAAAKSQAVARAMADQMATGGLVRAEFRPKLDQMLNGKFDPQAVDAWVRGMKPPRDESAAPTMQTRIEGGMAINERWNPTKRVWEEVGRGERFSKERPGIVQVGGDGGGAKAPAGYRYKPDGTLEHIPGGPADPTKRPPILKAIPTPLANKLTEAAELADATQRFSTTFKDEFGGKTITGGLTNTAGRILGDETGQSQWWQDYELHQSQVRNKLFGSALTAPEIEAWNKSAINPRMESGQIKKNLERRRKLEQTALDRLMKGTAAGGYNKDQIEAFTGRSVETTSGGAQPETPQRRESDKNNDPLGIRGKKK